MRLATKTGLLCTIASIRGVAAVAEWTGLLTGRRLRLLSGRGTCCAHHGRLLLITAHVGRARQTLLFDAGPEAATFPRNSDILGVDFSAVEALVLSHGHWDHAGGLVAAIEAVSKARRNKVDSHRVRDRVPGARPPSR